MVDAVTLAALPLFVKLAGRAVILIGEGPAADAKRRILIRAGAVIAGEDTDAALAIVALDDAGEAAATVTRLRARGILVNAVDRPALCDFTLPAIVDRAPVLIAIGTGGVSAGLAAALRQRLEGLIPAQLGALAIALQRARGTMRVRFPDGAARRRALGAVLGDGGALDPLSPDAGSDPAAVARWLDGAGGSGDRAERIALRSGDPDDLTLREARLLGQADRVFHRDAIPPAILNRARADAERIACDCMPADPGNGLSIDLSWTG